MMALSGLSGSEALRQPIRNKTKKRLADSTTRSVLPAFRLYDAEKSRRYVC